MELRCILWRRNHTGCGKVPMYAGKVGLEVLAEAHQRKDCAPVVLMAHATRGSLQARHAALHADGWRLIWQRASYHARLR